MKIATHSGIFHADDICAIATLRLAGVLTELVRTRDEVILRQCDMRVDVGRRYDPEHGDFDHHQTAGAGVRDNGVPYASFGLIWRQYGAEITGSPQAAMLVDERLVQLIDAEDTGYEMFYARTPSIYPYSVSTVFASFNPTWETEPTSAQMDDSFLQAVEVAAALIQRESAAARAQLIAQDIVRKAVAESADQRLVILPRYVPWKQTIVTEVPAAVYVIYPVWPYVQGQWAVKAVPMQVNSFVARKPLPASWAGKTAEELAAVTGVHNAVFCHMARFLAIAGSKAGVIRLAEQALAA